MLSSTTYYVARNTMKYKSVLAVMFYAALLVNANAQFMQQGNKLVGMGAVGAGNQGWSVSISADGNTAIVGGPFDGVAGATWVFTRSGGVWTQQGNKLVGTGAVGPATQANSIAISADGNTSIVGGPFDNSSAGAAWVFTRSGGVWTQQGGKLVGTGAVGSARQGWSVSISSDGNTAIVGGYVDNGAVGAAWVFTRSGGVWTQQGSKLVGTGAVGNSGQGYSVSISSDGNTALVGAYNDSGSAGAAWVFTRSGGVWTQQGNKLVGVGAVGSARQGTSVSISSDGNTAIVGGYADNGNAGATWVFTRSGGVWTQQGNKLVGTGASTPASQGFSVSISSDGSTAIVGGPGDNSGAGAAWVYSSGPQDVLCSGELPKGFALEQNYPNPFNPMTKIRYDLPKQSVVTLKLYNLLGQEVATLVNEEMKPGSYDAMWDATGFSSGVYFYRLTAGTSTQTKKLLLLK
jgi:hypothetical protein